MTTHHDPVSRRNFLAFVAASPLVAAAGFDRSTFVRLLQQEPDLISAASEALNAFDFEPVAKKKLPPAHWGYLATGTDDDGTIRANREGFSRWDLRVRRLIDVSKV